MKLTLEPLLRLEQRLELKQELKLYLPGEFADYLNIEEDQDFGLLMKSLPFLCLHEFSHPLYDKKKISIPKVQAPLGIDHQGNFYHNALETGIDRAAMLLGPSIGRYSSKEMYSAHYAMMERIFRDHFELEKYPQEPTFMARLYCQIKEHQEKTASDILKKKLENLIEQADSSGINDQRFERIVKSYTDVYQGTEVRS